MKERNMAKQRETKEIQDYAEFKRKQLEDENAKE